MKAPLGQSFQSVLEELAKEMKQFNDMDKKLAHLEEISTEKHSTKEEVEKETECNFYVC